MKLHEIVEDYVYASEKLQRVYNANPLLCCTAYPRVPPVIYLLPFSP